MNSYYQEGYSAFGDGLDYEDNPYDAVFENDLYHSWADGYARAERERQEEIERGQDDYYGYVHDTHWDHEEGDL